jgi:hypothetical protein
LFGVRTQTFQLNARGGMSTLSRSLDSSLRQPGREITNVEADYQRLLEGAYDDVRAVFPQIRSPMEAAAVKGDSQAGWHVHIEVPRLPPFDWQGGAADAYEARFKAWAGLIRKHCKRAPRWATLADAGTARAGDLMVFFPTENPPPSRRMAWDSAAVLGFLVLALVVVTSLFFAGVSELDHLSKLVR